MLELDDKVRQNQLACLPVAKSGRAEAELVERHPGLLDLIERSKYIKIDSVTLQTRLHEREAKAVGGSKAKAAFREDFDQSPSMAKSKPRSYREHDSQSKSPSLKAKKSAADLMFEMDDDSEAEATDYGKPTPIRRRPVTETGNDPLIPPAMPIDNILHGQNEYGSSLKEENSIAALVSPSSYTNKVSKAVASSPDTICLNSKRPWAAPAISTSKIGMKDIMAQASSNRVSNITAGLSLHAKNSEASTLNTPQKLSQRERKKQQQQQLQSQPPQPMATPSPVLVEDQAQGKKAASPWQVASTGPKVSLRDVLGAESSRAFPQQGSVARTPSPLNLRQTVSGKAPSTRRVVSSPQQTPMPAQQRSASTPDTPKIKGHTQSPPSRSSSSQIPIQSIRHTAPPVEPSLQLSMADILSQQQTEKDIIKEAAAKRSLQEIQEEQAFQEWWDEESRKVKAEAEEAAKPATRGRRGVRGKGRGGSRGRGSGKGEGDGGHEGASGSGRRKGRGKGGKKPVHSG